MPSPKPKIDHQIKKRKPQKMIMWVNEKDWRQMGGHGEVVYDDVEGLYFHGLHL